MPNVSGRDPESVTPGSLNGILRTQAICRYCKSWQCVFLQAARIYTISGVNLVSCPGRSPTWSSLFTPLRFMDSSPVRKVGASLSATKAASAAVSPVIIDSISGTASGLVFPQFGRFCWLRTCQQARSTSRNHSLCGVSSVDGKRLLPPLDY